MQARLNIFQKSMLQWNDLHPYNAVHVVRIPGALELERLKNVITTTLEGKGLTGLTLNRRLGTYQYHSGPSSAEIKITTPDAALSPCFAEEIEHQLNTPFTRRLGIAGPPVRHQWLRLLGAYRLRFRGPGAVGTALKVIRRGLADFMLAGGYDSMLHPIGLSGFCLLGALSTDNETPEQASRPFDATRNGFVLGEGAGFLVLEEWQAARARGAHIYAELAGDGNSLSSYRITDSHPSGDGPIQAMQQALADAKVPAESVDYVNAHGTSTIMNDRSESAALRTVMGGRIDKVAVSSTKSCMGHLISAAGAVEAGICALAIRDGIAPINANLTRPDPDCDLNIVRGESRPMRIRVALSNSLGFGGSNSCLVFQQPDDTDESQPGRLAQIPTP
jgi:hypothetical protein